jgi:hypothetical protein
VHTGAAPRFSVFEAAAATAHGASHRPPDVTLSSQGCLQRRRVHTDAALWFSDVEVAATTALGASHRLLDDPLSS